jgi:hypothetical protein
VVLVNVIAFIVIGLVPVFFTVVDFATLVVFTSWFPNDNGAPVSWMALPTPLRFTVFTWLKNPFEVIVMLPFTLPDAVGEKYTYMVQLVPFAITAGQLSASLKFALVDMLLIVTGP